MDIKAKAIELVTNAVANGDCLICKLTPSQVYANVSGYGKAHRLIWEAEFGPIQTGLMICHACDTPRCININHLFCGTATDNMRDKYSKGRQGKTGPKKLLERIGDKIVELRKSGFTLAEIGNLYNVDRRTVSRFLGESI